MKGGGGGLKKKLHFFFKKRIIQKYLIHHFFNNENPFDNQFICYLENCAFSFLNEHQGGLYRSITRICAYIIIWQCKKINIRTNMYKPD